MADYASLAQGEEDKKKPPCSEVRKQLLGKLMPENHGAEGFFKGVGSYPVGLYRAMKQSSGYLSYNMIHGVNNYRRSEALLNDVIGELATNEEFRGRAGDVFSVLVQNNWEKGLGRGATGALVGAGIKFGLKGPGWAGPTLAIAAAKGDAVHLISQGVDPFISLTAAILGTSDIETVDKFSEFLWDDSNLNKLPGVDCEEGN